MEKSIEGPPFLPFIRNIGSEPFVELGSTLKYHGGCLILTQKGGNLTHFCNPPVSFWVHGVYDVGKNRGWVSVGIDHDTATFAVESIRRWWRSMGKPVYRQAQRLLITADSGGSNGSRVRLWKLELQKLANETGLHISVCHLPPGNSKWNKIEHRLFSFISQNWRGKPLVS